ncbi:uncharacterized protein LOC134227154 isoform X1 [Armigeres subalbatus]|uniref:uncharacterized protein LOC134227154 isoform X1 n=1 Tax=Armigeres subalbatus TaxID=124917 RepID=UPI002ED34821
MVSNRHFRVMGFIYAGLCLAGSFLLIINASNTVKSINRNTNRDYVSGSSIAVLILSLISLVFNVFLTFGMIMHRVDFIRYHLRFISTIYVMVLLGLFIGCISGGIALGNMPSIDANIPSAAAVAMTLVVMIVITFVTLQFTLIAWILNGVIDVISEDRMRLISHNGDAIA